MEKVDAKRLGLLQGEGNIIKRRGSSGRSRDGGLRCEPDLIAEHFVISPE